MKEIIEEHKLNRVVVASCSPRTHEPLFQDNLRQVGLNKYLFEMANIRDQDSWVHQGEPEQATELAKDLIKMAIGRSLQLEAFQETQFKVVQRGLVVGGGLAGLTAALTLAEAGYDTTLVEKEVELGGLARRPHFTRDGQLVTTFMADLIQKVNANPRIQVLTDAQVVDFSGHLGKFISIVQTGDWPASGSAPRRGHSGPGGGGISAGGIPLWAVRPGDDPSGSGGKVCRWGATLHRAATWS